MADRPNILLIMTDQQHARMMSCAGNPWLTTPAIDGLARGGIRFGRAYCTNPVCVPSRISMATGMMPVRLGASDNDSGMAISALPPAVDENSLGRVIKAAGYDTFYGGKAHLCESLCPAKAGYDVYFRDEREALPSSCLEFITRRRGRPFFAVASFVNPHDICFAHRAHNGIDTHGVLELYRQASALPLEQLPRLPENHAVQHGEPASVDAHASTTAITPSGTMRKEYGERDWRINRWIYHRLTEQVDRQIGIILDGLRTAGLDHNTLVAFVSDHGNMDASHRLASKGFYYEESVGVPLILRYPGVIPAGRTDGEHLVSTGLDLLPTFCDFVGIEPPKHLLGRSVRPLAEGRDVGSWRSFVVSENDWFRMVRTQTTKYCVCRGAHTEEALVDLTNDPGEMLNLIDDPTSRTQVLAHRRYLEEWSRVSSDTAAAPYLYYDDLVPAGDAMDAGLRE